MSESNFDDKQILEELDRSILSLVEFRKKLTKKIGLQKPVVSMSEFLDMLRDRMPSFKAIVDELERFRTENKFDGVTISAGLYGVDKPQTHVWWTAVDPVDDLLSKDVDISALVDLLANPARVHFLQFLSRGSRSYTEISNHLQIRGGGFAHHATPLLRMKCIEREGRGQYRITELGWEILVRTLSLASRLAKA
jgi:hypothetical protein